VEQKRETQLSLISVDPESLEATSSMTAYFDELAERFDGGFDPGDTLTADADHFRPPNGRFLIGRYGDEVVACGGVHLLDSDVVEIKRMWVSNDARGKGFGSDMLAELEAVGIELGATTVKLDTNSVLDEAIALYLRSGYLDIDAYNDNPYARRWFAKELAVELAGED